MNFYILQGFTVTGSTNVASQVIQKNDMTKIVHIRLGHMSERGIQILSKQDLLCGHQVKNLNFFVTLCVQETSLY